MKGVYELSREYGGKLDEFRSPLSREWETILFKAIDILHSIERESKDYGVSTKHIETILLPIIANSQFDEKSINTGIQAVQELHETGDKFLAKKLKEVLDCLFAVKISMNKK